MIIVEHSSAAGCREGSLNHLVSLHGMALCRGTAVHACTAILASQSELPRGLRVHQSITSVLGLRHTSVIPSYDPLVSAEIVCHEWGSVKPHDTAAWSGPA